MRSEKIAILMKKGVLAFEKLSNPILQEYNLTGAQYRILKYLFLHQAEMVRQIDLEKYYSLTHPTTIGLLDQLEKKGFVCRKVNPEDARSRIITLTEHALQMQKELELVGERLERELTDALTEEERVQLSNLLYKLLSKFE